MWAVIFYMFLGSLVFFFGLMMGALLAAIGFKARLEKSDTEIKRLRGLVTLETDARSFAPRDRLPPEDWEKAKRSLPDKI